MRRLGVIAAAGVLAAVVGGPIAGAASLGFVGSWTSTDPVDGSTQHIQIRGGGSHVQASYVDEFGTTCVDIGASSTVFTGVLAGSISGNELVAEFKSAGCGGRPVLRAADHFSWIFEYDPNTDTLWGAINDGPATWYRD